MNELSLFAGAGGGILGGVLLGWRTVCAVEIEPYPRAVLQQRQDDGILPPFPIWDDITTFDGRPWAGAVDVVTGGFPCQPFSTAAHGRNVAVDRWPDMLRVVGEVGPEHVFAENVSRRAIDKAADDLEAMGYSCRCVKAGTADVGGVAIRDRFWLVASANGYGESILSLDGEAPGMRLAPTIVPRSTIARLTGMDNVVARRMDRLKAIGNGQVPAVVKLAWETLTP